MDSQYSRLEGKDKADSSLALSNSWQFPQLRASPAFDDSPESIVSTSDNISKSVSSSSSDSTERPTLPPFNTILLPQTQPNHDHIHNQYFVKSRPEYPRGHTSVEAGPSKNHHDPNHLPQYDQPVSSKDNPHYRTIPVAYSYSHPYHRIPLQQPYSCGQRQTDAAFATPTPVRSYPPVYYPSPHSINQNRELAVYELEYSQDSSSPHEKDRKNICDYPGCGRRFPKLANLKVHVSVHTGVRHFKCTYCPAAFTTRNRLTIHERNHTNEKPYVCDYPGCQYAAKQKCGLTSHKLTHKTHEEKEAVRKEANEKNLKCPDCDKFYKSYESLNQHSWRDHKKSACVVPRIVRK